MSGPLFKIDFNESYQIEEEELAYFCDLIKNLAGIKMGPGKYELIRGRLRSRINQLGLKSYKEYKDYISKLPSGHEEFQTFVNMLTTNKTDFFREPRHFDFLEKTFLPSWLATNPDRKLKIWSAACSSGEEPYTLAMVLDRIMPDGHDYEIFATDIDTNIVKRAQNAVYSKDKLPEIPEKYRENSINIGQGAIKDWFRISPHLKNKIHFNQYNLLDENAVDGGPFDVVFCRNVFIYFSPETISQIVKRIYNNVYKGGYLLIGHSESLQGIKTDWQSTAPAIYKKGHTR